MFRLLVLVAIVCLTIALLGAASVLAGVNVQAWFIGGVLALAVYVGLYGYEMPARTIRS